jgi:hypothetical protein
MKSLIAAAILAALLPVAAPHSALAQTMTCADYLKADKQMQGQMGGATPTTGDPKMDAQAAALDKKMKDYCTKNPSVGVDKAMEEAMK